MGNVNNTLLNWYRSTIKDRFRGRLSINSSWRMYGVILLLGVLSFIAIYGVYVINPFYVDWLLTNTGDLGQHYLGWKGFKESDWVFPIGCTDLLAYPNRSSVIFTDSIPCLALIFKLFRPLLPNNFQYFGIWGVLCFILQGVFAGKIIYRFTHNRLFTIIGSELVIISPIMIWRMFGHTALAGQWLILLCMDVILRIMESDVDCISRKLYISIGIIGVLAASTHIYFIALCGLIVCGGVLSNILKQRSLKMGLAMMAVYIVSAGFTVFMLGGFSTKTSTGPTNELGLYSFNLNGFFNPLGWSCLLKDLKLYNPEQYEGFSYLGVGLILILIAVMITWISDEKITEKLNICRIDVLSVGIVLLVSLFVSLGPIATFFERELYTLLLPDFIWKLWSIFRSTGRFVWVIIYVIDLLTIIFIYKLMNHRMAIGWLIFALCIQILDIHLVIQNKNDYFSQKIRYEDFTNDSPFWKRVGEDKEIKNIILVPNARFFDQEEGNAIVNWALTNNKTLNSFYFSHDTSFGLVEENLQKSIKRKSPEDLFIFPDIDSVGNYILPGMNYYLYDNLVLGYYGTLTGEIPVVISKEIIKEDYR